MGPFVAKGGSLADTVGRRCLCNALLATIGLAQPRDGRTGRAAAADGRGRSRPARGFLAGRTHYSAADVISYLLGPETA